MLKSILKGSTIGILLSGTAAVGLAMLFPAPAGNTPPAMPQMDVPTANVDPAGVRDVAALATVTDAPNVVEAPEATAVADVPADPVADTDPLEEPQVATVDDAMAAPESVSEVAVTTTTEEPVLPNPQSLTPQPPASETQVTVSTDTAPTPAAPAMADTAPTPVIVDDVAVPTQVDIIVDVPTAPKETEVMTDDVVAEATPAPTEPVIEEDETPEVTDPQVEANPSAQVTAPTVIAIVTEDGQTMPTGSSGVQVNRPTDEPADAVATQEDPAPLDENAPALARFGAAFENPDSKPLMSVVLYDRSEMADALLSLSQLNFPVTIVIDPATDDAVEKMRLYRDAGLEVAVLNDFPVGATPSDVEVILSGIFSQLPEAVSLIDTGVTGLQTDRDVIEQAMAVLAEDGRGLLTISRGLNTALRAADEAGVPAATIYRDIDTEWQSARVIRRFLDQSAFRARQQSGVVLFGRLRPNTLTALKNWGKSSRAEQIAMAPLSAVLTEDQN